MNKIETSSVSFEGIADVADSESLEKLFEVVETFDEAEGVVRRC